MKSMNFRLIFILCCSFLFSNVTVNVIENNEEYVVVEYSINDFSSNLVSFDNEVFNEILLKDEPSFIEKNKPQLPHVNRSFIIPDFSSISVSVLSS